MRTARQVTPKEIDSERRTEEIKGLIIDLRRAALKRPHPT